MVSYCFAIVAFCFEMENNKCLQLAHDPRCTNSSRKSELPKKKQKQVVKPAGDDNTAQILLSGQLSEANCRIVGLFGDLFFFFSSFGHESSHKEGETVNFLKNLTALRRYRYPIGRSSDMFSEDSLIFAGHSDKMMCVASFFRLFFCFFVCIGALIFLSLFCRNICVAIYYLVYPLSSL